ncbi:Per1-like family protein [Zea mays]|uniref:Per1-like family protein n=1 Tax=Zea mays TaxID=4577 RepID=A0A1D6PL24_MAIZE|nr:Per1-like family protein [Zea mays]
MGLLGRRPWLLLLALASAAVAVAVAVEASEGDADPLYRPKHEGLYCDKHCSVSPVGTVGCHEWASFAAQDHICRRRRCGCSTCGSLRHSTAMGIRRWPCYLPRCGYPPVVPLVELCQGGC